MYHLIFKGVYYKMQKDDVGGGTGTGNMTDNLEATLNGKLTCIILFICLYL